ncbi:MAG: 3-oxoacyl-[acyl-carrier protein] reductase [Pirellulaceae bacterium]|jgi:3-oxoacyl-[acyl-carrier protein] reductase
MAPASTTNSLNKLTAVVTGSSSGIGRAIALAMANAGADVLVHARQNSRGANDVCEQVQSIGTKSHFILADMTVEADRASFAKQAWSWNNGVDIWINNAGGDVLTGSAADLSFNDKLQYLLQADVTATMDLSRRIGDQMKLRGSGSIINIGWDQARQGMAGDSGEMFAATKGAIMSFSLSLAQSLAPQVRVNCIAPGWIKTKWGDDASAYWQKRATRECLLQRWGTPADVANAATFLASPNAAFITGQVLAVNGGFRYQQDV